MDLEEIFRVTGKGVMYEDNDLRMSMSLLESSTFEVVGVGAGTGNKFSNTAELKPMKYKEAMKCEDKSLWGEAVDGVYRKLKNYQVFGAVRKEGVPDNAKLISTSVLW